MICTSCCYCDKSFEIGYESGDPGAGGYTDNVCAECGKTNFVQLVSFNGQTLSKEEFYKRHPDAKKVSF